MNSEDTPKQDSDSPIWDPSLMPDKCIYLLLNFTSNYEECLNQCENIDSIHSCGSLEDGYLPSRLRNRDWKLFILLENFKNVSKTVQGHNAMIITTSQLSETSSKPLSKDGKWWITKVESETNYE